MARKAAKKSRPVAPPTPVPDTPLPEFEEQDWQKLRHSSDDEIEEVDENETFECVACGKDFASEASWSNHERSKKHKQAVYRLRQELQLDEILLEEGMADLAVERYDSVVPTADLVLKRSRAIHPTAPYRRALPRTYQCSPRFRGQRLLNPSPR